MKLKHLLYIAALYIGISAEAHTVLFSEDFNISYTDNFPVMIEGDSNHPYPNIQSLFMDYNGVMQPWRMLKDVSTSQDGYIASHSIYQPADKSNDWLCSRAIEIPASGFTLSFDAQSVAFHSPARESDLWVYITEYPVTSKNDLPTGEATWVIEKLPFGDNPDTCIGDFTRYEFSLDTWAGKTIYINFANLNDDKDFLAIDNVCIQRLDTAEIQVEEIPMILHGSHTLPAVIQGTMEPGLTDWTLTARFSNGSEFTESGSSLALGEEKTFEIPFSIRGDEHLAYTLTLSSADAADIIIEGLIKGLTFMPAHRVLMEEATGLWCGNCPIGQYNIESMMLDPEMNDKIVPVSVHVPSSSHANYLVVEDYATQLGMTIAPAFRLDRELVTMTFSQANDTNYDPSNPESVAGTVRERASRLTMMDLSVKGEFIINGNDTTGIRATAEVIPALSSGHENRYAIGFILTENNVWLESHRSWTQQNYLSTHTELGELGGWTALPKVVPNVRLQDVARAVYGYHGLDNSLPGELKADQGYTFSQDLAIPDTKIISSKGTLDAPSIVAANCSLIAFIFDRETNAVVNAAYHPMTELTEKRFTTADLLATLAVEEVNLEEDSNAPVEFYSFDGLRIDHPVSGRMYIRKQGSKTAKIIF